MLTPYRREPTLDDLMRAAIELVRKHGVRITASRGSCLEVTGIMLELTNPRARLSRSESKGTPFSALGEFCWYLSGRNDYESITYYLKEAYKRERDVEEDGTIAGAYGPRLVGTDDNAQLERVIALLQDRSTTRKAVIRLFDASDLRTGQRDVPCTCTLQLLHRQDRLELVTYMRSNDLYRGLPHDMFCFTLLQEWMARRLGIEVGTYKHVVGSLHLYDEDSDAAERYLAEGYQSTLLPMPAMTPSDPQSALAALLDAENALRAKPPDFERTEKYERELDDYWSDLIRLLHAYRYWKDRNAAAIFRIRDSMKSPIYNPFLERKARDAEKRSEI